MMTQATMFPETTTAAAEELSVLHVRDTLGFYRVASESEIRDCAMHALAKTMRTGPVFDTPRAVKDYVALALGSLQHEVFAVLFVDAQHRLIAYKEMFRGTLTQTSVYPREVVREALHHNAAAVLLAHNHPSGVPEPSRADELLTQTLKSALQLVDTRVLDHLIVGGRHVVSMAERGTL